MNVNFLNPLMKKVVEKAVRHAVAALGVWLIANGWTDEGSWLEAAPGLTLFLGGLAWSLWEGRAGLQERNTALAMPKGSTTEDLHEMIKTEGAVPASLPVDTVPKLPSDAMPRTAKLGA